MSESFQSNNALETSLIKAATDAAARPQFLRDLLDATVFIESVGEKPAVVGGELVAGSKISIANIQYNGRTSVPFYTSPARLPVGTEYLGLGAKALFEITRGAYLILNPGLNYGKEFFPEEVAGLLNGSAFRPQDQHVMQKSTQVLIGHPKDYPQELVDALSRLYRQRPAVKRAWIGYYHNPERGPDGGLLLAVDVADAKDMDWISAESGIVIESVPKKQKFVDVVRYEKTGVGNYFSGQKPFYQKSALASLWSRVVG